MTVQLEMRIRIHERRSIKVAPSITRMIAGEHETTSSKMEPLITRTPKKRSNDYLITREKIYVFQVYIAWFPQEPFNERRCNPICSWGQEERILNLDFILEIGHETTRVSHNQSIPRKYKLNSTSLHIIPSLQCMEIQWYCVEQGSTRSISKVVTKKRLVQSRTAQPTYQRPIDPHSPARLDILFVHILHLILSLLSTPFRNKTPHQRSTTAISRYQKQLRRHRL